MKTAEKPWYFLAYKNWLAVRLRQNDAIDMDPAKFPTPDQIPPDEAPLILMPFIALGRYSDALQFLYTQLRLNFEEESVHARYIYYFLRHSSQTDLCLLPEVVDRNCAVLLQFKELDQRWVTIEDDSPLSSRGEFSSTSALGQVLIGKDKDESVYMPSGLVGQTPVSIVEIQTKYVRAFEDCKENFGRRFPGSSVLIEIKASSLQDLDRTGLVKSLEGRKRFIEECIDIYRTQIRSMHFFAGLIGVSELDAAELLTQHPNGLVRSWETTPQDFNREVESGLPAERIVLSISAIVTLILSDGWQFLDSSKRFFVSQLTSEQIDGWLYGVSGEMPEGEGCVHLDVDGQLVFHRKTNADQHSRRNKLNAARQWLDEHAEKLSSSQIVGIPAEKRSLYEECIGLHNLEAISIAQEQAALLWSDDMVVGIAAKVDFEVPIAWTQLVMRCWVGSPALSQDEFDLVTAKLASWRYMNIIWNPSTIIAAARHSSWQVGEWPFLQCVKFISQVGPVNERVRIVAECLKLLRRSDCIELRQTPVIQSLLNAVGDAAAVRIMMRGLDSIFGVDTLSSRFIRDEMEYWLRTWIA